MSNAAPNDPEENPRDERADSSWARTQVALVRSLMDEIVRLDRPESVRVAALEEQLGEERLRLEQALRGRPSDAPISGTRATEEGDRSARERTP